jgi:hypothetical protein
MLGIAMISYKIYTQSIYRNTIEVYYNKNIQETSNRFRILVYQCGSYNQKPKFLDLSTSINNTYCEKYGYSYKYIEYKKDVAPPFWLKVICLRDLINEHFNEYDFIMYLDCDAVFYDFEMRLETIIEQVSNQGDYSFVVGKEPNPFSLINTGVFLVKCNDAGVDIVNRWSLMCISESNDLIDRCNKWTYANDIWSCSEKYAGDAYEQGAFENLYKDNPNNIAILNPYFFSNPFKMFKSYILHLMAKKDNERYLILSEYKQILSKKDIELNTLCPDA